MDVMQQLSHKIACNALLLRKPMVHGSMLIIFTIGTVTQRQEDWSNFVRFILPVDTSYEYQHTNTSNGKSDTIAPPQTCNASINVNVNINLCRSIIAQLL